MLGRKCMPVAPLLRVETGARGFSYQRYLCAAAKTEFGAALTLVDTKSHQATTYSCEQRTFTTRVQVADAKTQ